MHEVVFETEFVLEIDYTTDFSDHTRNVSDLLDVQNDEIEKQIRTLVFDAVSCIATEHNPLCSECSLNKLGIGGKKVSHILLGECRRRSTLSALYVLSLFAKDMMAILDERNRCKSFLKK